MTLIRLSVAARKLKVSRAYLHQLCQQQRIKGAQVDPLSGWWLIPEGFKLKDKDYRPKGRPKRAKT